MRLRILSHARARMADRGITELDILMALREYHTSAETPKNSVLYVGPGESGSDLKVWLFPPGLAVDPVTVKSVAWKD